MEMSLSEYIKEFYCSNDQNDYLQYLLSDASFKNSVKCINHFYSYNPETKEFYISKSDEEWSLNELDTERRKPHIRYEEKLKRYASNFSGFSKIIHNELCELAIEIQSADEEVLPNIIPFQDLVKWTRLKYNKFYEILVRLRYPVCIYQDKIWWGKISINNQHSELIEKIFNKYKLDDSETEETNFYKIIDILTKEIWSPNFQTAKGDNNRGVLVDILVSLDEYFGETNSKDIGKKNAAKLYGVMKHPQKGKGYY